MKRTKLVNGLKSQKIKSKKFSMKRKHRWLTSCQLSNWLTSQWESLVMFAKHEQMKVIRTNKLQLTWVILSMVMKKLTNLVQAPLASPVFFQKMILIVWRTLLKMIAPMLLKRQSIVTETSALLIYPCGCTSAWLGSLQTMSGVTFSHQFCSIRSAWLLEHFLWSSS